MTIQYYYKSIQCNGISSALAMRTVQRVKTKQYRQWAVINFVDIVFFLPFGTLNGNKKFRNVLN